MNRRLTLAILLVMTPAAHAGFNTSTFEDLNPTQLVNWDRNNFGTPGVTNSSYFNSGGNTFNNSYESTFGTWSGWSVSSQTDVNNPGGQNPDYNYQYTAIPGIGANGSLTYAVANTYGQGANPLHPATSFVNLAPGTSAISAQVTNTAYDFFSMTYGDGFAHKFGAGDFLQLTIEGYTSTNGTGSKVGEVDFYLANFLGADSKSYYIVNTWQTVDLTALAGARSLAFGLVSSDNGDFGINTPAEFALDNLVSGTAAVPEPSSWLMSLIGLGMGSLAYRRARSRTDHQDIRGNR